MRDVFIRWVDYRDTVKCTDYVLTMGGDDIMYHVGALSWTSGECSSKKSWFC